MRIALDAMGTDNAPDAEVAGAVKVAQTTDLEIILVGDETMLGEKLAAYPKCANITIHHAPQVIGAHEQPVMAVRKKRQSSLVTAVRLVKDGAAQAVISAGNTGAVMVSARTILGAIRGVARSAITQTLPTVSGKVVVLDLGANVDCTARHLRDFAEMGIAYSHYALGVENPRVGLLNIGEEGGKGGAVAREVYHNLMLAPHVNFVGNVEPKAMVDGKADVVVCDGFVGNLFLKTSEAAASFLGRMLREYFESSSMSKIGAVLARKALHQLKQRMDPNEYWGAPLLGVNNLAVILHGATSPRGIETALLGTRVAVESDIIEHIRQNIRNLRQSELPRANETAPENSETPPAAIETLGN